MLCMQQDVVVYRVWGPGVRAGWNDDRRGVEVAGGGVIERHKAVCSGNWERAICRNWYVKDTFLDLWSTFQLAVLSSSKWRSIFMCLQVKGEINQAA